MEDSLSMMQNGVKIAKPDTWKPPDFRSLIQAAGTEAGKSEFLMCLG